MDKTEMYSYNEFYLAIKRKENPDTYYNMAHGIFQARVLEWVAIAFSEWDTQETTNKQ